MGADTHEALRSHGEDRHWSSWSPTERGRKCAAWEAGRVRKDSKETACWTQGVDLRDKRHVSRTRKHVPEVRQHAKLTVTAPAADPMAKVAGHHGSAQPACMGGNSGRAASEGGLIVGPTTVVVSNSFPSGGDHT